MTDSADNGKSSRPRAKKARFIVYALILLGLLLWLRHENNLREAADQAAAGARAQRQQEIAAENSRLKAAYALVKKAGDADDSDQQILVYDEIIQTYRDDPSASMKIYVSWALYKRALAEPDPAEKARRLDEVVDTYCDVPDKRVKSYVSAALDKRLKLIEDGAEKIAFADSLAERLGPRLPDSLSADLLSAKAKATPDPAGQIAVYDEMLARFLPSADDEAFDLAVIAALNKMKLVTDPAEQIRLCDIAIEAFLKTPQRTRYYLFDQAIEKKAELAGDPALPLALYDQVIANNVTEDSVVQARSARLHLLKDDKERLAACDEFIAAHEASKSDFVQLMVARAMARKADLLPDHEAAKALLLVIIEKCAGLKDDRAKHLANESVAKLARMSGDLTIATRYYDEEAARAEDDLTAIRALNSKADLIRDPAEKLRLYDQIIARGEKSRERQVSDMVARAFREKLNLTEDKQAKIKLYDAIIARTEESRNPRSRARAARFMLDKAGLLDDREARISLYDEVMARGLASGNQDELAAAAQAMLEKAMVIDDRAEKIKLYDAVLLDLGPKNDSLFYISLPMILRERAELESGTPEKLRVYEQVLAKIGPGLEPETRISLLLDQVKLAGDRTDQIRLYDNIIEQCERNLRGLEKDGEGRSTGEFKRGLIMSSLGQAILGRADLSANAAEKLKLYDIYLNYPPVSRLGFMGFQLETILTLKAELTDQPSTKSDYYDHQIQMAATDRERAAWYLQKSITAEVKDRPAIDEEIIAKFYDNTQDDVEWIVAWALLRKIESTPSPAEREALCDRLIERYRGGAGRQVMSSVARAMILKAQAARNDSRKLELYSAVIDQYQGLDDYAVKMAVDEAIAAKIRLELRRDAK